MRSSICFFKSEVTFRLSGKESLTKWIRAVIKNEGRQPGSINFIFCSDAFLLSLNRRYLRHNYFTDIITFEFSDDNTVSGEIYISIDRVRDNANSFGMSFRNELNRVVIHGVLHLLGYNDSNSSQKEQMRRKEDACLSLLHSSTWN